MKDFNLKVKQIVSIPFPDEIPEIININYDLWTLKVILKFFTSDTLIYVVFKNVIGFRVLNEGNLLEFWNPEIRVSGWIWEIEEGGWFTLEKLRIDFVEGLHENKLRKEYLVLGINDCVSVITCSSPEISYSE